MDRRLVLTGIAAFAAGPALAQAQQASPQSTQAPSGGAAGGVYGGAGAALGQAEMQHMQQTLAGGTVALQTSEMALQKAQNPHVKQFAQFERDEQTTIAEVLRSFQEPAATATAGQARTGAGGGAAGSAPEIPADKARMMQQLQQASGAEFDRMYIEGQMQGHQELLQIQETYLRSGRNREHVNVAKLARGHIKEHLARLQEIQKELRG
jgi:putative membrane protein